MSLVFWCFFSLLIIYLYLGFPLFLSLVAKLFKRNHRIDETYEPTVTLIIAAYNEEAVIQEKLENSLNLNYPADKLEILVVSDCSSDRTDEIVQNFPFNQVKLVRMSERTGKTSGLNRALEQVNSDMVVFSDANAIYDSMAIRKLVRHFVDSTVGYVVGHARYVTNSNSAAGKSEDLYWNYEVQIKQWESDFHSVVGGDGALYMIRRKLYQPLETTDINDFVNPLQIIAAGYRGLFDREAFCFENSAGNFEKEFGRKVRIVNRSFNGLLRVSELLNPFKFGRFTWLLVSHKLLRWFSPFVLLAHFIATLALPFVGSFAILPGLFLGFYLLLSLCALVGWFAERKGRKGSAPFYLAYYFILMNIASAYGVFRRLCGDQIVTWSTVRNDETSHRIGSTAVFIFVVLTFIASLLRLFPAPFTYSIDFFLEWNVYSLFFLLLYACIGYPLVLLAVRPLLKKSHRIDDSYEPSVTLLIAAYNEESVIAEKIQNSLELDYPTDKLQILLVSDGSTDGTEQTAGEFVEQGIKLLALTPNRGKVTALNEAFKLIDSDIVIMSDANVLYQSSVVRKLVRHFADPIVGSVSGKVVLINDDISYSAVENQYYNIEHLVQLLEGETGSMVGADGAMYALRKELYPWPEVDTILDDFVISMNIVCQGKRLIHDPEAIGFERNDHEMDMEFKRKVRIVAGGIQCLLRANAFPTRQQILTRFKFISHKVLRWFSGWILILLIGSLVLNYWLASSQSWLLHSITIGLVVLSIFETIGRIVPKLRKFVIFKYIHYLLLMFAASIVGTWKGLTGNQKVTWKQSEE